MADEVKQVRSVSHLGRLSGGWNLLAQDRSPVLSWAWALSWHEVYGSGHRLRVFTLGQDAGTEAILPLVQSLRRPWHLQLLGVAQLSEPGDILGSDQAAVDAIAENVQATRMPLWLARVPASSPLIPALSRRSVRGERCDVQSVKGTPYIALDDTWTEPERHLNAGRRSDFRGALRRAEKIGPVSQEVLSPTVDTLGPLLSDFIRVEGAGWKMTAGTALQVDHPMRRFYTTYAKRAAANGTLRLAVLRIGDAIAAMQFAVEDGSTYSLLKIGYDERFARCSPGSLLMLTTVRWVARRGLASYDFLGHEEPWIRTWTTTVHPCVSVHARPKSAWGMACRAEDAARGIRRRVIAAGKTRAQ